MNKEINRISFEIMLVSHLVLLMLATVVYGYTGPDSVEARIYIDCANFSEDIQSSFSIKFADEQLRSISVHFENCLDIPIGLFVGATSLRTLDITCPMLDRCRCVKCPGQLTSRIFEGLENLEELYLNGFEYLNRADSDILTPLRNLESLSWDGFGSVCLKYDAQSEVLKGLSGTSIKHLKLNHFHSSDNIEVLYLDKFLNISDTSLVSLDLLNVLTSAGGFLSKVQPNITSITLSLSDYFNIGVSTYLDILFFSNVQEVHCFIPDPTTVLAPPSRIFDQLLLLILHDELLEKLEKYPNNSCFFGTELDCSPSIRRIYLNNFRIPSTSFLPTSPICIRSSNNLEYFNFSGTILQFIPKFLGLTRLKTFIFENVHATSFANSAFGNLPALEWLSLAGNNLSDAISNNAFSKLENLISLDLSSCNITYIPKFEFTSLTSLRYLNLSGNRLTNYFDIQISNSTNLQVFNVSGNLISSLNEDMMQQFESMDHVLTVDLSSNPLSCLCNATQFVEWLQISQKEQNSKVHLEGLANYTCLYPNGSRPFVVQIDIRTLDEQCQVKNDLVNNSKCPCDDDIIQQLSRIRFSLVDYYCLDIDSNLVHMINLLPKCRNVFLTATFLAPLAVAGMLLVAILILSVISYRRMKAGQKPLIDCSQLNWTTGIYMALQFLHYRREENATFQNDAFVCFPDEFRRKYLVYFQPRLASEAGKIMSMDDHELGSPRVEAIIQSINESRVLVLILCPSFVADDWCNYFVLSAMRRPHAIIPVIYQEFECPNEVYTNLLENNRPLYWPQNLDHEDAFWVQLISRINRNVIGETITPRGGVYSRL